MKIAHLFGFPYYSFWSTCLQDALVGKRLTHLVISHSKDIAISISRAVQGNEIAVSDRDKKRYHQAGSPRTR